MSLPIARARRKNVPSSQRSPCSMTPSHSFTESSNPRVVMSQARLQLADLPVVLDQPHLGDHPREVVVERLVGGHQPVDGGRHAAVHPGLPGRGERRPRARRRAAPRGRATPTARRATAAGRPTARRTAGRGRTRRCRGRTAGARRARPHRRRSRGRRRWSGCRRSRCARCRRGSGSRCRWRAPCSVPAGSTSRSPGNIPASLARRSAAGAVIGCGGRSSSRSPQPVRMNAA